MNENGSSRLIDSPNSEKDWRRPFIVFDLNQMKDTAVITSAQGRCRLSGLKILLADGAFFEFSNVADPFSTWRGSLDCFSSCGDFLCVARKFSLLMKEELRTGQPCEELVDWNATSFLRSNLQALASGDEAPLRSLIDGPVQQLMPESVALWSDFETHKSWVKTIYDNFRTTLDPSTLKQFRRVPSDGLREWIESLDGIRFVFQGIKSRGADDATALSLASQPSVCAGFISAMGLLPLWWLVNGGLDDASGEYLTNDLLDIEYAILAALSTSLESRDKRQTAIYSAIVAGYATRQAWFQQAL